MIKTEDLIGKPYAAGARGPNSYDCWGLIMEVAKRSGIELPDIEVPGDEVIRGRIVSVQKRENFVRLPRAEPCCLVLFRIIDDYSRIRWHVGFVLENGGRFIHTTGRMGVNISSLGDPKWRLHIEGFYRYK